MSVTRYVLSCQYDNDGVPHAVMVEAAPSSPRAYVTESDYAALERELDVMARDAARWREARRRYLTDNHEAAIDAAIVAAAHI